MDWDSIFSRQKREAVIIILGLCNLLLSAAFMFLDIGLTIKNDNAVWWQNACSDREALVNERVRIGTEEFNAAKVMYYDRLERLEEKMTEVIATVQEKMNAADSGMVYYSEEILKYEVKTYPVFNRTQDLKDEVTSRLNMTKEMGLDYVLKGTQI